MIVTFLLQLVSQKHATKDLLPPKKFFGSQSESFVRKRKQELETYLRTLLQRHPMCAMPQALALFLDIKNYVSWILLYIIRAKLVNVLIDYNINLGFTHLTIYMLDLFRVIKIIKIRRLFLNVFPVISICYMLTDLFDFI